jgi:Common central domain of tyrosinase
MLGDGIRRDIATVSDEERTLFINAIRQLDDLTSSFVYGNNLGHEGADASGNITYWDMQEQIHKDGHAHNVDVHFGPAFIPWHRALINHFEKLLRQVDSRLSLHYWDWTTDPRVATADRVALFTPVFMGSASGNAGVPLQDFESTEIIGDPTEGIPGDGVHDHVWRAVGATAAKPSGAPDLDPDSVILHAVNGSGIEDFTSFAASLKNAHDSVAHSYIGGTLLDPHFSFHDPFVFLLHSNLDRIWATWQRMPGHQDRLDPARAYGNIAVDLHQAANYFDELVQPWAGVDLTGTLKTDLNPWKDNLLAQREPVAYNDPSIIIPASYDTAPHSSYFVVNQDTFSTSQVAVQLTFPAAFYLIYEGFEPKELGVTSTPAPAAPPNPPAFVFTSGGSNLTTLSAINPVMSLEDPLGAIDMPQRITIQYDLHFTDASEFPAAPAGEVAIAMRATLNYNVDTGTGGAVVNVNELAQTPLLLVDQPNPYMLKVDSTLSPPNPYWLSMDTRVFKVTTGQTIGVGPGAMTQADPTLLHPNPANDFIQGVVANFNSLPNNSGHPFLALSADEAGSTLYLPGQDSAGVNVYNYAVAKVRYLAPLTVPASNVRVFFRAFSTLVSALDYDQTSGSTGNYRRSGNTPAAVPLLGIESNEVASIPFFAAPRVNTNAGTAGAVSMTTQTDDAATNTHTLNGGGAVEQVAYFGCWLDINRTDLRFPRNPLADPGGPDGPFTGTAPGNPLLSIQQLMNGFHQCMVAEMFFWPPGTVSDPIHLLATPASSDRLSQRNLALVPSGNPHWPETHTVQHTFLLKPSPFAAGNETTFVQEAAPKPGKLANQSVAFFATAPARRLGPDELMIHWHNVPRDSQVKIYLPEANVDEILRLNALRQHPVVLEKLDAHTLGCKVADVTIIPLPSAPEGNLPGLLSLTLPPGIRTGQTFRLSAQQISGVQNKILGGFQMTIPVKDDPEILPSEIAKLAVLRYIQQSIPTSSRWHGISQRYVGEIAERVRGLGGDPDNVRPSPNGVDVECEGGDAEVFDRLPI